MDLASVTTTASSVTGWIAVLPIDWAIIAGLLVVMVVLSLRPGSTHAMTALFAIPIAFLLNTTLPKAFLIGPFVQTLTSPLAHAAVFVVLLVVAVAFVARISASFSTLGGIVEALLSAVSVTALLLVVWQLVPSLDAVWHFGPVISATFAEAYRLWWIIFSLLLLAFARS